MTDSPSSNKPHDEKVSFWKSSKGKVLGGSLGTGLFAIVSFAADLGDVFDRVKGDVGSKVEYQNERAKDDTEAIKEIKIGNNTEIDEINEPVKKVKLEADGPKETNYLITGLSKNNEEIKEVVVLLVDSNGQNNTNTLDIQTSLEQSLSHEGFEPVAIFNSSLNQTIIRSWINSRNIQVAKLTDYIDYQALGSFNVEYSIASNGRDICSIRLNFVLTDLVSKRSVLRVLEDFRGNGYDKESAYQAALRQIEDYLFMK